MVLVRILVEPPITIARPSGCNCPLCKLGCTSAFRFQFRRDHSLRQSVYYSVSSSLFSRSERVSPQLLGVATEQMSLSLRHTLVGLFIVLNSTSGNAVDIVVGFVALFKGEVRIVQTFVCTRIFLHYTCLLCTDAWLYFIRYSLGFGLLLLRWYVDVSASRTRTLIRAAPQLACSCARAGLRRLPQKR